MANPRTRTVRDNARDLETTVERLDAHPDGNIASIRIARGWTTQAQQGLSLEDVSDLHRALGAILDEQQPGAVVTLREEVRREEIDRLLGHLRASRP